MTITIKLPKNWTTTKFKYFFETSKGLSITKENLSESGIPVISYGQVHSKYGVKVDSSKDILPFVSEDYLKYKQSLLNRGDYTFADTSEDIEGSGNFSTKLNDNGLLFAGYHTIIARLMDKENNDFRYFMYLFASEWFRDQVRNSVSGVKVFSITQAILKNTEVIVPSALTEQKAIADFLDGESVKFGKVAKLISDEIATLRAYKKSLIYETVTKGLDKTAPLKDSGVDWIGEIPVGWEVGKLKYVAEIKGRIGFRGYTTEDIVDEGEGAVTLSPSNIQNSELDLKKSTYISWEKYVESPEIMVKENDILFVKTGSSYGKCCLIPKIDVPATINPQLILIKSFAISAKYLNYIFQTDFISHQIENIVGGSTIPTLSQENLSNMNLLLPSNLTEQQKIADYLDEKTKQVDDIITIKEAQLSNLTKQCKSLIYDVVTGKKNM
ncbi:MAG: restriction endonuclease subunit S [Streptococcaceae bacterium]|nr:restriction endonuclease subunit S [Streptococcaceae bacterium]